MVARRVAIAVSLLVILVLAIGLASGIWGTPSRIFPDLSTSLSPTPVTLSTVLIAGLADGINPCAFTVLLLFITAVTSIYRGVETTNHKASHIKILIYGGAFVFAIFLTYLTLGTGLLSASATLTNNHVGTRLGALAAIFLGLWMIKDYFIPGFGPRLTAPSALGEFVHKWGQRATLGAMAGLGVLVGLCTVPCSGAVYFGVLSMLALQQNFALSYLYLIIYNLMFIVPLLGILVVASARPTLNRLAHWNTHHRERIRLGLGISVVVLGLTILAIA